MALPAGRIDAVRMTTQPTGADVAAFLNAIPDETRKADATTLCLLMSEVTGEPPALWGASIVGFGRYQYRYASGHQGTSALASFAPRKQHLVLYLAGGFDDMYASLTAKLGPYKAGKGCLYLKRLSDVDLDVLRELIVRSVEVHRAQDRAARQKS